MGQRASNTATISFDDVEIPAENLLGEENKGFKLAMMTLDRTRPGVSAMAVGIGRAAFEFAAEYSKERVQFGVPIAMHQAIQFMIADMATKVDAGRLLVWNSAVLLDQGKRNTLRLLGGQALRRRLGDGDHRRRRPGLRRLRLHQGVPGRETDARREDHAALRGHQPDPAPGDRQRGAAAAQHRRGHAGGRGRRQEGQRLRGEPGRAGSRYGLQPMDCLRARRGRERRRARRLLAPPSRSGSRPPAGATRSTILEAQARAPRPRSWCRSATGGWRSRRSPSSAAPPR